MDVFQENFENHSFLKVNFFLWDIETISRLLAAVLGQDIEEDEEQDPLNF